jgi:hypothetical protein
MSELLVKTSVKLGKAIPVKNVEKSESESSTHYQYKPEPDTYWAVQVEDYSGDGERCLLFTENEMMNIIPRYSFPREMTDRLLSGRLYPVKEGAKTGYITELVIYKADGTVEADGECRLVYIGSWLLEKADIRANSHPKTVTNKGLITDLLD